MRIYSGFLVWGSGILIILGLFMVFVIVGWPGQPDRCIHTSPDTCYCEAFDPADIFAGAPGVRQPVNTWSNLYAIATSFIVAVSIYRDRKALLSLHFPNHLRSYSAVPDLYVFTVLFLGLGSMWFHGSLTDWGGVLDGASMYMFTAFLAFYSIRRFWDAAWFFWIGYSLTVIVFTSLHAFSITSPFTNIMILVIAYLVIEAYIWIRSGQIMQGKATTRLFWTLALISILTATFFWWASHTGNFLCNPNSLFQPHGLLWHPLAGLTAVLLYFYWRDADDPV